jgi:hypothetical protein
MFLVGSTAAIPSHLSPLALLRLLLLITISSPFTCTCPLKIGDSCVSPSKAKVSSINVSSDFVGT